MAQKDIHDEPFDKGTITKLEIFEDYAQAWIPTFVMQSALEIHIFDFFSGPGYDMYNVPGSPIRLLEKINSFIGHFFQKKTKVVLHFNEFEPEKKTQIKFAKLKQNCATYLDQNNRLNFFVTINYYNSNADELFFKLLPIINKYPSLVYLDQNGVKFISDEYLKELEKLKTTDFIYFVSSSYFKWLGGTEEFKKVLEFDMEELKNIQNTEMHRKVLNKIKSKLPSSTELKLFPFSLKKEGNVFGIIFGAKHFRAVDKFLDIAWKRNKINGEADFDIDEDLKKQQLSMFDNRKTTKIEKFHLDLESQLLGKLLQTNKDVLIFTYENGHLPSHASDCVKAIKKRGLIEYDSRTPAINYDTVFKDKRIIKYLIKK